MKVSLYKKVGAEFLWEFLNVSEVERLEGEFGSRYFERSAQVDVGKFLTQRLEKFASELRNFEITTGDISENIVETVYQKDPSFKFRWHYGSTVEVVGEDSAQITFYEKNNHIKQWSCVKEAIDKGLVKKVGEKIQPTFFWYKSTLPIVHLIPQDFHVFGTIDYNSKNPNLRLARNLVACAKKLGYKTMICES